MARFDIYGTSVCSINDLRSRLEALLSVQFVAHESLYFGEYFRFSSDDGEVMQIKTNEIDQDGYKLEEQHSDFDVLLYLHGSHRWDFLTSTFLSIEGLKLLRSEEID